MKIHYLGFSSKYCTFSSKFPFLLKINRNTDPKWDKSISCSYSSSLSALAPLKICTPPTFTIISSCPPNLNYKSPFLTETPICWVLTLKMFPTPTPKNITSLISISCPLRATISWMLALVKTLKDWLQRFSKKSSINLFH